MIKISANLSKKVPLPGVGYSSQQYGGSVEIEISDSDSAEAIQEKMRRLYAMLSRAVDEQIQAASKPVTSVAAATTPQPDPVPAPAGGNGNGSRSGVAQYPRRPVSATAAQQRAIFAISKRLGMELPVLLSDYDVRDVGELSVRDASRLIDSLKQRQAAK